MKSFIFVFLLTPCLLSADGNIIDKLNAKISQEKFICQTKIESIQDKFNDKEDKMDFLYFMSRLNTLTDIENYIKTIEK